MPSHPNQKALGGTVKDALLQFAKDLLEGGIAGATAVLLATDLDVTNYKVLLAALAAGFVKGVISASMRRLATRPASVPYDPGLE
jgi:hypothetical protein